LIFGLYYYIINNATFKKKEGNATFKKKEGDLK